MTKEINEHVTNYARYTNAIKTLEDKRTSEKNWIQMELDSNPNDYPNRIVESTGGIRYKVSEPVQLAVNPDAVFTESQLALLYQMKLEQLNTNLLSECTVKDLKAIGIKESNDNLGFGKPFIYKSVSARFTLQG